MSANIYFPAFGYWDGRRGTFSPTASQSSSAPGHFPFFRAPPLLHFDGPKCFNSCLATMKQKVSPSQMCTIVLWGRRCIPVFAQHRSPGPAGTCPESGQAGHFPETTSENTQLHNLCSCLRKNRKKRPQVSPQASYY